MIVREYVFIAAAIFHMPFLCLKLNAVSFADIWSIRSSSVFWSCLLMTTAYSIFCARSKPSQTHVAFQCATCMRERASPACATSHSVVARSTYESHMPCARQVGARSSEVATGCKSFRFFLNGSMVVIPSSGPTSCFISPAGNAYNPTAQISGGSQRHPVSWPRQSFSFYARLYASLSHFCL